MCVCGGGRKASHNFLSPEPLSMANPCHFSSRIVVFGSDFLSVFFHAKTTDRLDLAWMHPAPRPKTTNTSRHIECTKSARIFCPQQTCVVLPDPVSPEIRTTLFSLMVFTISSLMLNTGSTRLKLSRSEEPRPGGTCGTPLFSLPVVVLLSSFATETKVNSR